MKGSWIFGEVLEFLLYRELDCVRRLASFRKHVEGLELEKQAELLTCPNAAKEEIGKLLNELQQQVSTIFSPCVLIKFVPG